MSLRYRFSPAAFAVAAALGAVIAPVHAQTNINAGGSVTPAPTVGFFGGTQFGTTQMATFNITNTQGGTANGNNLTGTIYSAAFAGGAGGTLDFYYQIQLTGGAGSNNTAFQSLAIGEMLSGINASVGQVTADIDGAGPFIAGTTASGQTQRTFTGAGLTFNFANFIGSGSSSYTQVVRTNAVSTLNGSGGVVGTGVAQTAVGNVLVAGMAAPTTGAPEPGSLALLGMGLVSMGGVVVRRKQSKKSA